MNNVDDFVDVEEFLQDKRKETYEHIHGTTDICDIRILITLYTRASNHLYVDHMANYKVLVGWLGFPIPSTIDYPKLPNYLINWDIMYLAKILGVSIEEVFYTLLKIEKIKE